MIRLQHTVDKSASQCEALPPDTPLSVTILCASDNAAERVFSHYKKDGAKRQSDSNQVHLCAAASAISQMFDTQFCRCTLRGKQCYQSTRAAAVPSELRNDIVGVLGLDSLPLLAPASLHKQTHSDRAGNYLSQFNPRLVASLYNFPLVADGTGQTIGIVELGGAYFQGDLDAYFATLGLGTAPQVNVVSVDGAQQVDDDASVEVALDVDVIAAIVPKANITVYFAENSMRGFYRAIQVAGQNNSVVSISWGLDEASWVSAGGYALAFQLLFESLASRTTILASSGDWGSAGLTGSGQHVLFPASVPGCVACGGTTLLCSASTNTIVGETTWPGSGGGYSALYAKPQYQTAAVPTRTVRGVPDICGNADPATGYIVRCRGETLIVGGTSAVSPLWAALVAQLNQSRPGKPVLGGSANLRLYAMAGTAAFRDIIGGGNGAFRAGQGWDATTGLGVPNGLGILEALDSVPSSVASIAPTSGPYTGGTSVSIAGIGFTGVTSVKFGSVAADNVVVVSDTQITATAPAATGSALAVVAVTLAKSGGTTVATRNNAFTYVDLPPTVTGISPATGSTVGGTVVTLQGSEMLRVVTLSVGGRNVPIRSKTATTLTFIAPPISAPSSVSVVIANSAGVASTTYAYAVMPSIRLIDPKPIDIRGGTLNVEGVQLQTLVGATVDGVAAPITAQTATKLVLAMPPHAAGVASLALTDGASRQLTRQIAYADTRPSITSVTLLKSNGRQGAATARIDGANLASASRVLFASTMAPIVSRSQTTLLVRAPRVLSAVTVSVVGSATTATFTYSPQA